MKNGPRESKRGRKRIAERWVILALAIIARIEVQLLFTFSDRLLGEKEFLDMLNKKKEKLII
ncbi:MAG: hypothetical protein K9W45_03940 [Candidatus Heimdallarchaeum aukensis]|uniref:Uncharacterized protein n=1 Tax=Candidatus Heimdallarchaeum aukensis TaxID=2876573 RepID=A0A9Y1FM29_9ARCH|nr:MAG: hypothetical protein K9W45_03940 [Candidatus Heimdallarchaeum aukensis]